MFVYLHLYIDKNCVIVSTISDGGFTKKGFSYKHMKNYKST